jgi:glutathione synthase/RimK-type ligase-like ATP-grasp enzyme
LLLGQAYAYTEFDWRVGIINGEALYVCQYFMTKGHWQIYDHGSGGEVEGDHRTLAVADAPPHVVEMALRAASLIGNGLYGVDLKETADGILVIEVNDNPSIEHGVEDQVIGDALYDRVINEFLIRIESGKHQAAKK